MRVQLSAKLRAPILGGLRALYLTATTFLEDQPLQTGASVQVTAQWKGQQILSEHIPLQTLSNGLNLLFDASVARLDPESLMLDFHLSQDAPPTQFTAFLMPM